MAQSAQTDDKERRRAKYLIRRIRKFLMEGDWKIRLSVVGESERFRKLNETSENSIGLCDYEDQILHVHYKKEILVIVVHEALHALYPDNDEDETLRLEELVMRHLGPIQAKNLLVAAMFWS